MTIRVAVPNKGSLAESAAVLLKEAGYRVRNDPKELTIFDYTNDIEFFYLRPRDIAVYVAQGTLDLGITGRDLVFDSGVQVIEKLALGFAHSRFRFACKKEDSYTLEHISGHRIATSYPEVVRSYLSQRNISATIVPLDGAVEISVQLGVADIIADVVESGRSLRNNGLVAFGDPICVSEAVLIEQPDLYPEKKREQFIARIHGVVVAQKFVMLDYDCPQELIAAALHITPGLESATVSPLADPAWSAVRALVPRDQANILMDQLAELGAKAILISDIRTCRI